MKLNSAQLEAFSAVAKTLHFTRAAASIGVTQSALSQRIAKLEEELETTLFIRDRTEIKLTEAGYQVLRFCQLNESVEAELLSDLKGSHGQLAGSVRIAGFSSVNRSLLIPALKNLMVENENLSIQLMTKEFWELPDLLRRGEVDYILTNQKSESADIENLLLGNEENVLVTSKKSPEIEIFLDHDEKDLITASYFGNTGTRRRPKMRYLGDVYALIDGVKNGYGRAVLPRHLIEHEKDLIIQNEKKALKVPIYLQFFKQPFYRRAHDEILKETQSYFRARLS